MKDDTNEKLDYEVDDEVDDDIEALDNTGNILQNTIAQSANLGAFNLAISPITEFTQINPNTMKVDNNALEEAEAVKRREEEDST